MYCKVLLLVVGTVARVTRRRRSSFNVRYRPKLDPCNAKRNPPKWVPDSVLKESSLREALSQAKEHAVAVELISVTDFYPLKTIKASTIIDSEYYDLIKLRIDYFEKLAEIFEKLK